MFYINFLCLENLLQVVLDLVVGMMVRCFQCSDCRICDFGNLFVFHFVEISEAEDYPLFFRKTLYCLVQLSLHLVSVEVCILVDLPFKYSGRGIQRYQGLEFLFPQVIQDFVCRYPVQPCVESGFASEVWKCGPYLDD